jgi:alkylated DNA repair dioxygenase AlkB
LSYNQKLLARGFKAINLVDSEIYVLENIYDAAEATLIQQQLTEQINWQQPVIRLFGRSRPIPRLQAWHGDPGCSYRYSGMSLQPEAWGATLSALKMRVQDLTGVSFNSALLNLYRDGNDSMGWHADDEPELGEDPVIASLSFGEARNFKFRHKQLRTSHSIRLLNASLLVMCGTTQEFWQHSIAKSKRELTPRINITFRTIVC